MPHKELRPEDVTAIWDGREQLPYDLSPLKMVKGTLQSGDYSVAGLELIVSYERKSCSDLLGCIGRERDRFERELDRLRAFPVRGVVVEASWADLRQGYDCGEGAPWRSQLNPAQVTASLEAWSVTYGIEFIMAGARGAAQQTIARRLFFAAKREWERLLAFQPTLRIA